MVRHWDMILNLSSVVVQKYILTVNEGRYCSSPDIHRKAVKSLSLWSQIMLSLCGRTASVHFWMLLYRIPVRRNSRI